jgi:hypothetical protein
MFGIEYNLKDLSVFCVLCDRLFDFHNKEMSEIYGAHEYSAKNNNGCKWYNDCMYNTKA